jgi:hypothetical protein
MSPYKPLKSEKTSYNGLRDIESYCVTQLREIVMMSMKKTSGLKDLENLGVFPYL